VGERWHNESFAFLGGQAVIYLRVSTIDQTTANQERELREIASRMGCEIVKVYRDHGISGAKGRDKRPAFDKLCRDAARREFRHGHGVVGGPVRPQPAGFGRFPEWRSR
jgi:Resolvase, N terminal domain